MVKICGRCFQTLAQKECKTERKEANAVSPRSLVFSLEAIWGDKSG